MFFFQFNKPLIKSILMEIRARLFYGALSSLTCSLLSKNIQKEDDVMDGGCVKAVVERKKMAVGTTTMLQN